MAILYDEIRGKIPANKFYPPRIDKTRFLERSRLIEELLHGRGKNSRILVVEAQAGQGKTTLAAQYLQKTGANFAWYQVGSEDGDPVLFLAALFTCLKNALPGFDSPLLEAMIGRGEVTASELPRCLNILLGDLDGHLREEFFLVFDDAHLLEGRPHSQFFLGHLLETSPPNLRFLVASRRPVNLDIRALKYGRDTFALGNEALALTPAECSELFHHVFSNPLPEKVVRQLHAATEGWPMGLVLTAQAIERGTAPDAIVSRGHGHLLDYFKGEVLSQISSELQRALLKLSLLDQMPVPLAERVTEVPDIRGELISLSRRNYFVRQLDEEGAVFRFHHLFQDFLQEKVRQELPPAEVTGVIKLAAAFFLEEREPERALNYFIMAGDYPAVERVLANEGLSLYRMGRAGTLGTILSSLSEEVIQQHGYISLCLGLAFLEEDPPIAASYFEKARYVFARDKNQAGELLSICHNVHSLVYVSCHFDQGISLLREAGKIYNNIQSGLEKNIKIDILLNLSSGHAFFTGDIRSVYRLTRISMDLAEGQGLENSLIFARFIRGMASCLIGRWSELRKEIEETFCFSANSVLSSINKMLIHTLALNYYAISGDVHKFIDLANHSRESLKWNLVTRSATEPFNLLFQGDGWLGQGDLKRSLEFLQKGISMGLAAASPHMQSQYLHYSAYIAALSGDKNAALEAAGESLRLRKKAGGKVFVALNNMIIGGAYAQLEMVAQAETHLARSIELSRELGEKYIRAGAYAHSAYLKWKVQRLSTALEDLGACLTCMRENGYPHFFSWTPKLMTPLLEIAVQHGIETDYARHLARERLGLEILDDGESIPLLEIQALGGLRLGIQGHILLRAEDFTPAQRDLLALLVAAPGLKISQERLKALLWPESPAEKTRANLDNLLMRLRKTLDKALRQHPARNYLSLKKGMVCLENCRVDALAFQKHVDKGFHHTKRKEFWQANNAFQSAHSLWGGSFLPNVMGTDDLRDFSIQLEQRFIDASLKWAEILLMTGRSDKAARVLYEALRLDRIHDELNRRLYHLHVQAENLAAAKSILRNYGEALREEAFSEEEIEEILAGMVASNNAR